MKIYILEDSPIMVERITARLAAIPFVEIIGVSNCEEEAFSDIARLHPDFLIIDISTKEGNGTTFLKKVKAELPDIKASMFDYSTAESFVKFMLLGTDFHFDKTKEFIEKHYKI